MRLGAYETGEELARGGHGVVYRARGPDGRDVALKVLLDQRLASPTALKRFEAEVRALARLRHPHVVALLDAGQRDGSPWMALELIEGQTLGERLSRGPLPVAEALVVMTQLARALDYVHAQGLLHRDLTPQNVLLQGSRALLTDFGLTVAEGDDGPRLTHSGVCLGTPGYWPPEQALGQLAAIDARSDVYGWGALLYACLTGDPPQEVASLQAAFEFRRPPSPAASRPEVPAHLAELCARCLERDPAARPSSAAALLEALDAESVPRRPRRWGRRVGLILGGVALGVLGAWALWDDSGEVELQRLVQEGEALLAQEEPEAALERFSRATSLDPASAEAWGGSAWARCKLGDHAESLGEFARALELNPRSALTLARRGVALHQLGDSPAGLADLDRAVALDPGSEVARYNRGVVLYALGRIEQALEAFQSCPARADARLMAGCCLFDLRRTLEAEAAFRRALELDPSSVGLWENLANVLARDGRTEEALACLDRACALAPRASVPHAHQGELLASLGRLEEALGSFDRAVAGDGATVAMACGRAALLVELGRLGEARDALRGVLLEHPDEALAHSDLATVEVALGDLRQARVHYERALDLDPQRLSALVGYGRLRGMQGEEAEALHYLERALSLDPNHGEAYAYLSSALLQLERYEEALRAAESALEHELPGGMSARLRQRCESLRRRLGR